MLDIGYALLTILFFLLMLAYVKWCESLGARSATERERPDERAS